MKHKKGWIRPRHQIARTLLFATLGVYERLRYNVRVEQLPRDKQRQCLVLYNHQTPSDQFFVGMAFKKHLYYVASEDIFSNGLASSVIRYLVAPIPIKKQTTDVKAIINCIRVAREGGSIAIAPEGNRTYSGKTEHIKPAIAALARKLGLPLAIFRIEGGYGVQPRWSDVVRRGRMRVYCSRMIEPEEYADLDDAQLNDMLCRELYVNEAESDSGSFRHSRSAEYLERAIYVCPNCGFAALESHRDTFRCKGCGLEARYMPTKQLEGVNCELPFRFVNDWYEYQTDFINSLDPRELTEKPVFTDTVNVTRVIVYRKKQPVAKGAVFSLFGDRIAVENGGELPAELSFEDVSAMSVLGRNKLNIYYGDSIYQLKGGKRFCALKYMNMYYRYKNVTDGGNDGKFLGL